MATGEEVVAELVSEDETTVTIKMTFWETKIKQLEYNEPDKSNPELNVKTPLQMLILE